jgi:hypothetical protein
MQRNSQKCDKQKSKGKNDRIFHSTFLVKSFRHEFSPKSFFGVFEVPLVKKRTKTPLTKTHEKITKKETHLPTSLSIAAIW